MTMFRQIDKEKQLIARCEKSLALEKLKKRRADTRRKIELGGLVIKSRLSNYNKTIILGGLSYLVQLMERQDYLKLFEAAGKKLFLEK